MEDEPVRTYSDITGWFVPLDRAVFDAVLGAQVDDPPGHLVELGPYFGRSTVIIGDHWRPDERFVVVDLFGQTDTLGDDDVDEANRREATISYSRLTQEGFERNYLALHDTLPEIVVGDSALIGEHIDPGTARFVHVDASHLYDQVVVDVRSAKRLLRPGGVVVFDDYRSEHTPGVAAAVWGAVFFHGLIPVAVTPMKLYGVFDDPAPYLAAIDALTAGDPQFWAEEQVVHGHRIRRMQHRPRAAAAVVPTPPGPRPALPGWRRLRRTIATDYVPPAVTRWWIGRRTR